VQHLEGQLIEDNQIEVVLLDQILPKNITIFILLNKK